MPAHGLRQRTESGVHFTCTCGFHSNKESDHAFHVQTANDRERAARCAHEARRVAHQLAPIGVSMGDRPDVDVLAGPPTVTGARVTYQRPNGQQFEILVLELEEPAATESAEIAAGESWCASAARDQLRGWFDVRWRPISNPNDVIAYLCGVDRGEHGWCVVVYGGERLDAAYQTFLHPDPIRTLAADRGAFDQILTPTESVSRAMVEWVKAANGVR